MFAQSKLPAGCVLCLLHSGAEAQAGCSLSSWGGPWKGLSPSLPGSWSWELAALAYLGQRGSAVGGPCPPPWDHHLWHLAEDECNCARSQVVPVLAVPRKSQPGFSVSAFVPALLSR